MTWVGAVPTQDETMRLRREEFETRLSGRIVESIAATRQAAVAVLLRFNTPEDPELLLMLRSEREGDPWSGQVCLPGGKKEETDEDLLATARRETREELGFDVERIGQYVGPLDPVHAMSRGRRLSTSVEPFVYFQERSPQISMSEEAVATFWLPLKAAQKGELDFAYQYRSKTQSIDLPAWQFDGHVVWGLTYQILTSMLRLLD